MSEITAEQCVKLEIIKRVASKNNVRLFKDEHMYDVIGDTFNTGFEGEYEDDFQEILYEIRDEGFEVNLSTKTYSRHYEVDCYVLEIEGKWIAYDYYYGGGKHGEPEEFDWLSTCRYVNCEERVVTKVERTFSEIVE